MAIQDHPRYSIISNFLQTLINRIRDRQDAFFSGKGKFFQGIIIPTVPCDGVVEVVIDPAVHPTDQIENWTDFDSVTFRANTRFAVQIELHVHNSPSGWGWILLVFITYAGLDPDPYGTMGSRWVYQHCGGTAPGSGILDEWYIIPTNGSR